ncbi:MAG: insulinase family protein [Paludibacteraceae bacterium]|nr:insulinase family protein [Paludibacteraceae bacterium]
MKKMILLSMAVLMSVTMLLAQSREGLTEYKLANGLTVMLWEDHDQPDVTGYVAVRAGAMDEPAEYTGLAHYLEHMLFKGTQRIGALDWEKEKPHYEEIIRLYDEYAETTDEAKRLELTKKINEESIEAAKYATVEDFFVLLDGIGATGVNAFTSYDMTCYHNSFPAANMYKWLTIFSDRLIDPVYRTFQAELENVFEEYNMYQDNVGTHTRQNLFRKLYEGHPYERDVIGLPEHLKNPRLSKLIEFYNTWYVPNNMALIIVGDFDAETTKPMIEETFGRLQYKELPERPTYPKTSFAGNPKHKFKVGYYPMVVWAYDGVNMTDKDLLPLQFVVSLLNNSTNTGLLDKLNIDGTVSSVGASVDARRDQGRILIQAIPYFDANQQTYESNAATEKIVNAEINRLKMGDIPDWLIQTVKAEYAQNYKLAFESSDTKMDALVSSFIYNTPIDDIFTENDRVQALTKADIQRIAKKYFDADHMTLTFDEGDPKKNKLAKPAIKPLELLNSQETEYAKAFKALPQGTLKQTFMNLNDVVVTEIDENVKLHYATNPKNNIFSLELVFGVGTAKKPMLEYVTSLMNRAGIMPNIDPQEFRRQLSELGGRCGYGVSNSYFYVSIIGDEEHLAEICQLVQRQMLMPKFDTKQFDAVKGSELSSRFMMSKMDGLQADALREYVLYDKESEYIDVVPFMDVYYMDELKLKVEFLDAIKYALDIHYCGQKPVEEVKDILTKNLPLQEGVIPSTSPEIRQKKTYDKTQVYFLANSNVQQSTIYFYFNGKPYDKDQSVLFQAFNQYFSGGFTGIVLDEIREKRSMAYTASGQAVRGPLPGKESYFMGYIGTQSDKAVDAINVFMSLLDSMPEYPERIESVKAALRQNAQISKPSFRSKTEAYDAWREMGYDMDPAKYNQEAINNLTFEQIKQFYETYIKGQPVSIIVMGDPKLIDQKALQAKYGKIVKVSKTRLFAPLDLDF